MNYRQQARKRGCGTSQKRPGGDFNAAALIGDCTKRASSRCAVRFLVVWSLFGILAAMIARAEEMPAPGTIPDSIRAEYWRVIAAEQANARQWAEANTRKIQAEVAMANAERNQAGLTLERQAAEQAIADACGAGGWQMGESGPECKMEKPIE